MIPRFISFGIRVGVAGGLVHWTRDHGLWGDAKQAAAFYDCLYRETSKLLVNVPVHFPEVPKSNEIGTFVHVNWNKAVVTTFDGVMAAPHKVCEWSVEGYKSVSKLLEEQPNSS